MSDNDKTIELNRRRVLGGIATIGAASAALGAGTFAAFSNQETSQDNTIQTGTLTLDGISESPVDISGLLPEESTDDITVTTTYEGDVNAPTLDWGIVTENDDVPNGSGSFADVLDVQTAELTIDDQQVDTYDGGQLTDLESVYTGVADDSSSPSVTDGDDVQLTLNFQLQDVNNGYQDASIDFAVAFKARQDSADPLEETDITVNSS